MGRAFAEGLDRIWEEVIFKAGAAEPRGESELRAVRFLAWAEGHTEKGPKAKLAWGYIVVGVLFGSWGWVMAARSRFQKKIDNVRWVDVTGSQFALAVGTPIGIEMVAATAMPETILRTRGEFLSVIDGVNAPGIAARVAFGVILVPEGTGSTVLWSPIVDANAPWLAWDVMHLIYEEAVTDVIYYGGAFGRRVVDSKAMRKVRNREVQLVFENANVNGNPQAFAGFSGRMLFGS